MSYKNYHDGRRYLFLGDRIPLREENVRIGIKYRKVDKKFCSRERPWVTNSGDLCPEGQIVQVHNIVGPGISPSPSSDVVVLRHLPYDDTYGMGSTGWVSWFVLCFQEIVEGMEFESADQGQIE